MLLIIAYTKTLFLFGEIRQRDRLLTKIRFFPIVLLTLDWDYSLTPNKEPLPRFTPAFLYHQKKT